jgi:hypothetical protein
MGSIGNNKWRGRIEPAEAVERCSHHRSIPDERKELLRAIRAGSGPKPGPGAAGHQYRDERWVIAHDGITSIQSGDTKSSWSSFSNFFCIRFRFSFEQERNCNSRIPVPESSDRIVDPDYGVTVRNDDCRIPADRYQHCFFRPFEVADPFAGGG